MEKGLISIIIPLYNAEAYMDRCINSLLCQTYGQLEVLLVEDGSRDGTAARCDWWQTQDPRIRVFHKTNDGVSAARNFGMERAAGEFITFVDADDWADKAMLEMLLQGLLENGADVAGCGYRTAYAADEKLSAKEDPGVMPSAWEKAVFQCKSAAAFIKENFLNSDTRCWSKLYSRKSLEGVRFPEGLTIGEDMLFLLNVLKKQDIKVAITNYQGYYYFQNPTGVMQRTFRDSYMDQITCWQLAAEQIGSRYPDLKAQAEGILMVSVMLTAGKLALLPADSRRPYQDKINYCHGLIGEILKDKKAYQTVSTGYKLKILLFRISPAVYMNMYHLWKK